MCCVWFVLLILVVIFFFFGKVFFLFWLLKFFGFWLVVILEMVIGNCVNVFDWVLLICFWNFVERERIIVILIILIFEVKVVKKVCFFLVWILLKDKCSVVVNFILVCFNLKGFFFLCLIWGCELWWIWLFENLIIWLVYLWVNLGLWVIIIINFFFESFWISVIICRLVFEFNVLVGLL